MDAPELVDREKFRLKLKALDAPLKVLLDQLAIELRTCVECRNVDCLERREKLPLIALALGDRLRRKVGPAVVVAGNTEVGRKLRERVQPPIPDLIEEIVEALLLTRNRFRSRCAGG